MDQTYYKGISFNQYQKNKDFLLKNVDIVKQDLLNYIFTRRGERVMLPTFGSRIPDLLFEPLDETTLTLIEAEVTEIINYDPRVEGVAYNVEPLYDQKAVNIEIELHYIELNFNDTLYIRLDFLGN